ncbi:MAG TPA: MurR/RpiR family transcriptional regulator [Chloroflexi bacterium]|nr:MurR/RpiR family transcriptional regulator [Chloroflexota bacterium]
MFRERIQDHYEGLTPSFRKLADFILEEELEAAFMTATEMADRLGVDAATVVRFAQTIGYKGFRQMIKEVQRVVKGELIASFAPDLDAADDVGLFRSLLENERHNLAQIQVQLTDRANTVLPTLLNGERIWVLGQGMGTHVSALCASVLRDLDLPAVSISCDPLVAASNLKGVGAEDVVVGFSITGMDLNVADALRFARQRGARTIAFSASPIAGAALAAETTITCPGVTHVHVPSFTSLVALVAVLAAAFAVRYPEKAAAQRENLCHSFEQILELQTRSSAVVDVEKLWREF